jgi:DNA repair exonuclease SbcCD ATPase subunit
MIFGKLIIHNFFRVKHLEINLSQLGPTFIEGINRDVGKSNESGKSTIFMALCWCWYGRFPGGEARPGDSVVNPLEKHDCYVESELWDGKEKIVAKRTRMEGAKHKDANLYVNYDGAEKVFDLRQTDMSASTAYITNILGMDYDAFLKQRYFAQEDVVPITRMKNTELKKYFLENVLSLDWTYRCHEKAKDDKSRIEAIIVRDGALRDGARRNLVTYHDKIKELRKKRLDWEYARLDRQDALAKEYQEAADLARAAEKQNAQVDKKLAALDAKHKKQVTRLNKDLVALAIPEGIDEEIERLEEEYRKIIVMVSHTERDVEHRAGRIKTMEEQIANIEKCIGEECETCGTKITKKHIPFMVKELRAEINEVAKEQVALGTKRVESENRSKAILRSLEAKKKEREGQKDIRQARADLRVKIAHLDSAWGEEKYKIKEDWVDISVIDKDMQRIINEQSKTEENPFDSLWRDERGGLRNVTGHMRKLKAQIEERKQELEIVIFWVRGFSGNGIQSFLLESITPVINRGIASYMGDLANGRISVKLRTVKQLKGGGYAEDFGVDINNMDGSNTFVSLSSGAKKRVDLAVSLAVADFQRSMSAKDLQFLVFDEVTAVMDSFWEQRFYELIKKRFAKTACYVISHKELDQTLFDRTIRVIKQNGETRLEA